MTDTYNGWPNRETWALARHISNNEGDNRYMTNTAEYLVSWAGDDLDLIGLVQEMAIRINDWVADVWDTALHAHNPVYDEPTRDTVIMILDVGSLWRVDFESIAEEYITKALINTQETEKS